MKANRAASTAAAVILLGLAVWLAWPRSEPGQGRRVAEREMAVAGPRFEILEIGLERDYGNARLDLEVRFENRTDSALDLRPPEARLVSVRGDEREDVADFTLGASDVPGIAAGEVGRAVLRYWLEEHHLEGGLILEIDGRTRTVKTGAPVDLETYETGQRVEVGGGPWATD